MKYYPVCFYNVKDPENPSWYIMFNPIDRTGAWGHYHFNVHINAIDGLVLKIEDNSGNAIG